MSFHFDARGDSSEDDAGGGLDLAAWKTGAAAPRGSAKGGPVAPVARMVAANYDDEDDDSQSATPLVAFQTGRKRKSPSASRSPPRVSFQAINEQIPDNGSTFDLQSIDSDILQLPTEDNEEEEEDVEALAGRTLFVQIPRDEVDRDDFEDYTALSRSVRRVLQEERLKNRKIMYRVMFEDTHSEEVRLMCSLAL